jgi:hypothetical protein
MANSAVGMGIPSKYASFVDPDWDPSWIAGLSQAAQKEALIKWMNFYFSNS